MNLKLFSIATLMFISASCLSQICPGDTTHRNFAIPGYSTLMGYHGQLQIQLPGLSLSAKCDEFIDSLVANYSSELGDLEISRTGIFTTSSSSLVEYQQYVNDVKVMNNRILLSLNSSEELRSFDVNIVMDTICLDTLLNLTDTITEPGDFYLQQKGGVWTLQQNYSPSVPNMNCGDSETFDLWVNFPEHSCSQDVLNGISSNNIDFLEVGMDEEDQIIVCGKYANLKTGLFSESPEDMDEPFMDYRDEDGSYSNGLRPLYETVMCYYHLNSAFEYIDTKLSAKMVDAGFPSFGLRKDIVFDPFSDSSLPNFSVRYDSNIPVINFKGEDDSGTCSTLNFIDYSEDADFIVEMAFELLLKEKFSYPLNEPTEGLGNGTCAFLVWEYMIETGYTHDLIGDFGGKTTGLIEIPIKTNLEQTYEGLPGLNRVRDNAGVWASTLAAVFLKFEEFSAEDYFMSLLFKSMKRWTDATNQFHASFYLFDEIEMFHQAHPEVLTVSQFCSILEIFEERYADFDYNSNDEIEYNFMMDYLIKDTYLVQNGMPTLEDIGNEPNEESAYYDYSPSIWNCRNNSDCDYNQIPATNVDNYLNVLVVNRSKGCFWDGTVEVFANISSTLSTWPKQWGGLKDQMGNYIDYNIVIDGTTVQVARNIAQIDLGTDAFVQVGDDRLYSVLWYPWTPDPTSKLKYFTNTIQQGYLARIESDLDPLYDEGEGYSTALVRSNNNMAQRKINTITYIGYPDISHTPILVSGRSVASSSDTIHLESTFLYQDSLVSVSNFDTLGVIKLLFPPALVTGSISSSVIGSGFTWLNDSIMVLTSPDFNLSIVVDTGVVYPIVLLYQAPASGYIPFSFQFEQFNNDGCFDGGQQFVVSQSGITPRSEEVSTDQVSLLNAFPNPTQDLISIQFDGKIALRDLQVFDFMGRQVYSSIEDEPMVSLSLSTWPKGYYIARARNASGELHSVSFVKVNSN